MDVRWLCLASQTPSLPLSRNPLVATWGSLWLRYRDPGQKNVGRIWSFAIQQDMFLERNKVFQDFGLGVLPQLLQRCRRPWPSSIFESECLGVFIIVFLSKYDTWHDIYFVLQSTGTVSNQLVDWIRQWKPFTTSHSPTWLTCKHSTCKRDSSTIHPFSRGVKLYKIWFDGTHR